MSKKKNLSFIRNITIIFHIMFLLCPIGLIMNQINKYFYTRLNKQKLILKRGIEYDTIYNDSLLFI